MIKSKSNLITAGLLALVLSLIVGCSSSPHHGEIDYGEPPTGSYEDALNKWTAQDKAYSGASESLQVMATLLSRDIVEHQVFNDAEIYHWTPDQYRDHRQKALYENES